MITLESRPRINSHVRSRNEKFGKLIIASNLPMLCINDDATIIWDLCDGKNNVSEIIDKIKNETHSKTLNLENIEKNTISFLQYLLRLNLITVDD